MKIDGADKKILYAVTKSYISYAVTKSYIFGNIINGLFSRM